MRSPRFPVEGIVFRNRPAAVVALIRIRSVEELHEIVAVRIVGDPRRDTADELALLLELQELREFVLLDFQLHADGIERAFHHLVLVSVQRVGSRRDWNDQRLAVRQRTPAIGTLLVPEFVEQRVGGGRIVSQRALPIRDVTDNAGRDRVVGLDHLPIAHDLDFGFDVIGHRQRTPQRDLLLREAADDRVEHVPVDVANLGIDDPVEPDPLGGQLRLELAVLNRVGGHRPFHVHDVELAVLETRASAIGPPPRTP